MPVGDTDTDTIVAVSSPVGRGAVCVIRLSGQDTAAILGRALGKADGKPLVRRLQDDPRRLAHAWVLGAAGQPIDEVLAVFFAGPNSYTGQDMGEVHCHGGKLAASQVVQRLMELGARPAQEGEFTRRAFVNGKMDLTRAEAVMQIVDARTPGQLGGACQAIKGALGESVRELGERISEIIAQLEAELEFPEEQDVGEPDPIEPVLSALDGFKAGLQRAGGPADEVVLYGRPNVGKSSLVNVLAGRRVSIVSEQAMTTRDAVAAEATLCGVRVCLVDTAGLTEREDLGSVDRQAVELAREKIDSAALPIMVTDAQELAAGESSRSRSDARQATERGLWVVNKTDMLPANVAEKITSQTRQAGGIPVSVKTGDGLSELERIIGDEVVKNIGPPDGIPANARQFGALARIRKGLQDAARMVADGHSELAVEDLKQALAELGQLTGEKIEADILDRIFSRFCIGK